MVNTMRSVAASAAKFISILTVLLAAFGCDQDSGLVAAPADASVTIDTTGWVLPVVCDKNFECYPGGVEPPCTRSYRCTDNTCQLATKVDQINAALAGNPCDDGTLCTTNDKCDGKGGCAGSGINCDDGNNCTSDDCAATTGCVSTAVSAVCTDGDVCTIAEVCKNGQCASTPLDCNDNNPCTTDSCDPKKGCVNMNNMAACTDGNACTSDDTCKDGACAGTPVVCDDKNPCTTDTCSSVDGCVTAPVLDGKVCSDGDPSTKSDACLAGACVGKPAVFCETDEECLAWVNTTCGTVACVEGACILTSADSFDDGNPCTADGCDVETGVFHKPKIGQACDDGNACTVTDMCAADASCKGSAVLCDDGNACTTDGCDIMTGCYAQPQSSADWVDNKWWTKDGCSIATGQTHVPYFVYITAFQSVDLDDFFEAYAEAKYSVKLGDTLGVTSKKASGTLVLTASEICPSYLLNTKNPVTFTSYSKSLIDDVLYVNGGAQVTVKGDDGVELAVTLLPPESFTPDMMTIPPDGFSTQLRDYCLNLMKGK